MPERVGERAGAEHGLAASSRLRSPSVSGSAQSFSVTRDDLGPALALEQRRDGAVDAAADIATSTRLGGAALARRAVRAGGGRRERAVQRVGGELGGVALAAATARRAPPSTSSAPIARRLEHGAPSTSSAAAALAAAIVAPQPSASKLDRGDPAVLDRSEIRDEIAAGGAPGGAGEGALAAGPRRRLVAQVVLEGLHIHMRRVGS